VLFRLRRNLTSTHATNISTILCVSLISLRRRNWSLWLVHYFIDGLLTVPLNCARVSVCKFLSSTLRFYMKMSYYIRLGFGVLASEGWWQAWQTSSEVTRSCYCQRQDWKTPRWAWGEQVPGMWFFFPSVLWCCWLMIMIMADTRAYSRECRPATYSKTLIEWQYKHVTKSVRIL